MMITNSNFFVWLFDVGSGIAVFRHRNIQLELCVKHSVYDYGHLIKPLFYRDSSTSSTWYTLWLPLFYKCVGWRIILIIYKELPHD